MVTEGRKQHEAAELAGIPYDTLYRALKRPEGVKFKTRVLSEFRESTAERAYVRVAELSEEASSEHVKLDANKTLLSLDKRYVAASKTIHEGTVNHVVTPGYVIDLGDAQQIHSPLDDRGIIEAYQEDSADNPTS